MPFRTLIVIEKYRLGSWKTVIDMLYATCAAEIVQVEGAPMAFGLVHRELQARRAAGGECFDLQALSVSTCASPPNSGWTKIATDWLSKAWHTRAISLKAISFGLIGVVNTAVDYGVFMIACAAYAHLPAALALSGWVSDACACGGPESILLIGANITSWLIAVTGSYIMNSSITFIAESGRQLRWRAYFTFVVSGIAGLFADTAALIFAAQILLLPIWMAKAAAILASFIVNFSLSHFVVFRVPGGVRR